MKILQVSGNTFCFDTGLSYIPFYKVNDNDIILLDTGLAQGERAVLNKSFEENNFNIVGIICTHAHIDHVGNASYFKEKYNCTLAMAETEAIICKSTINLKSYYSGQTVKEIEEYFGHMVCQVNIKIKEDESNVNIGGNIFKITHTPGHSAAHICITTPDDVTYVGDCLISYEVMKGAKMPYAYILKEDLKSKEKLQQLNSSKYIIAHKGTYDNITALINDNIEFYKSRAYKILEVINEPMTREQLIKSIVDQWGINVKTIRKHFVIERMLKSYIEYLLETGNIQIVFDNGIIKYAKI